MYLEHFALKCHPFRITPDPTFFHAGGGRGEVLNALIYAITTGEGIVKVIGEVGSGKTMLCRILEERLPASIEIVYLANPNLSPNDILYAVAFELKLPVTVETERLMVMQQLQTYLLGQHSAGRSVVVFIEEAQGMPVDTLEEIRLLSNLETHRHKLLQIVLFGQPELEKNLRKRTIRQLRERITHSFHLEPLTRAEVGEYIRFRLQAAGCEKSAVFSSKAERLIAQASQGLIRRINILADKAMLAVYVDPTKGALSPSALVRSRHVRLAIRDSEFNLPFFRPTRLMAATALSLIFVAGAAFGWHRFDAVSVLPVFLSGSAVFANGPLAGSREAIIPVAEQISPSPVTAMAPAPTTPALRPAATRLSVPESALATSPSRTDLVKTDTRLMALRHQATTQWLPNVDPDTFTIQLVTVDVGNDRYLERFLQQISPSSLLDNIYLCPVRQGGHDVWVVIYSTFPGASSARQAIDGLPQKLRRFQPFVRRFGELFDGSHPNGVPSVPET